MGRASIELLTNAFYGSETATPFCGTIINKRAAMDSVKQALISTSLSDKDLLAGAPITITNVVTDSGTSQAAGMNADTFELSSVPDAQGEVDGFLLTSFNDIKDEDGGVPYAHTGLLYNIGTFGSGIETWLPADSALDGVSITTPVYWDFTNGYLTAVTDDTTQTELPLHMISAVVDGLYLAADTDTLIQWTDVKCVRVRL